MSHQPEKPRSPGAFLCPVRILLLVTALALPGQLLAMERNGLGPLYVRSQNPGQSFRLTSLPQDARGLPAGQATLGVNNAVTNIWGESKGDNYLLDFQMYDLGLFAGYGLAHGLWLGLAVTERRIVNAHLDQMVLNAHKLAGLDQDGRDQVPKNDLRISIPDYGIDLNKATLENQLISRSAEGFLAWQWWHGGNHGLSAAAFVQWRHELSEEALVQEDSNDIAGGLAFTLPLDDDILYLNASYTKLGRVELGGLPTRRGLGNLTVSWEHRLSPTNSFYLQYMLDQQIFRDLGELSQPANQLQFGWKWRRDAMTWQFAVVENFIRFSNSPDISLSLGLRYDFRL